MRQEDVDVILVLWNEARVEAPTRLEPDYIIFAEKIIGREVELAARAVCFMCNDGNKPQKKGTSSWVHVFEGSSGYKTTEICRAANIRNREE